ncbi:hypothetical protein HMF8227_01996 [Saliniradius amylolyticus]|uniref:CusB-like beta-barrel domain-containing protein n=1 Tax=Saliniradius amylolyticus TaxID=2183582 RepID=A0A2S2E474_9ALTE|nr:efflux RND transporter periplasmic adaptor subunit [Saliniradius amylolyticus]AWL12466.1 hypothetical protein HMF8227_01996 [Saliniradius amylolyticus]
MKKWLIGIVILLAVPLWLWQRQSPLKVQTYRVNTGLVSHTVVNNRAGEIEACRRARLSFPIGGQIESVTVRAGDIVKGGQLLLALYNDDIQAQLAQAQAALDQSQLQRRRLCLLAERDQREATRLKRLMAQGLTSEEQVDVAESNARASQLACEAAQGSINQAQATIELYQAQLSKTQLTAPFPGTVAEVNGEVGEFATPSPPGIPTLPVVDLIDDSCYYVTAPIDEVDAAQIHLDMPVTVHIDAFRNTTLKARVRRIAPYVFAQQRQARTVEVEAKLTQPPPFPLLVGYSADMEILIEARTEVLRIPTPAIFNEDQVYRVVDGEIQVAKIQQGLSNWRYTEITEGLRSGDMIVLDTSVPLEAGMAVIPLSEQESTQ